MISNIQLLRAFAALNVVLFHVIGAASSYGLPVNYLSVLEGWGASGVDLFFVISGFVMVYTQWLNPKTAVEFMGNRVIRIVPIYWALTLLVSSYFFFAASVPEARPSPDHLVSSLFFVAGVVVKDMPVLYVGWTLEYEMFFYAVLALGMFLPGVKAKLLFPAVVLLALASVGAADLIVVEFIFGMLVALVYGRLRTSVYAKHLFVLGTALLIGSVFVDLDVNRVIKWGVPSALIVLSSCLMPQTKRPVLEMLGNASFSIYLTQVIGISACYKFSSAFLYWLPADIVASICFVTTVVLGTLVFYGVEKPMTSYARRMIGKNRDKHVPAERGA